MSFRAAVLAGVSEDMTLEEVEAGNLGPEDVLVRIGAAGLCHTDLEVIEGQLVYPMPIVLGHEAAGTIEQVGSEVAPERCGERVVLSWNPHCGHCFHCERGQHILCERYVELAPRAVHIGGDTRLRLNGQPLHTMFYTAAFADYVVVSAHCAIPIPREMPMDRACLIGCGVVTGVGAATNVAKLGYGDTVMVIGVGAVGLSAVQGARLAGAEQIVAVDKSDSKLRTALDVGATNVVHIGRDDPATAAFDLTRGRGIDCVLEAAGNEQALQMSAECCRVGGQIVWLGKVGINEQVAFRWGSLMGEKRITRCSYGGTRPTRDFPLLARSYLNGQLKLDELITQRIRLEQINDGFRDLQKGEVIRSVVVFDE